jgi:hypothetical protein
VQGDDGKNSDRDTQLANQQDLINKVITWLREEGLEPEEITHLRKDARYYGVVISDEVENTEQGERHRREAFHILFPIDRLDNLRISEIIIFDLKTQKSYSSLASTSKGILEQNRFYSDLGVALLRMNVYFVIKKNIRQLQSLEVSKVNSLME